MKSGFLFSDDPRVSLISKRCTVVCEGLGARKHKLEDFEFERNIGNGNLSQVWHVTLKSNPAESCALKIYEMAQVYRMDQVYSLQQERHAMLILNDPGNVNIIKFVGTFKDDVNAYIIYEFAERGELWEEIKYSGVINGQLSRWYILQILNGVEYMHNKGIVHRDLKCENIVIDKDGVLKIIDFGSSLDLNAKVCETQKSEDNVRRRRTFKHYVGTPNFMPPESISNIDSGKNRDLWSLGCLIYQLICGRPCFYGSTEYFVCKRVKARDIEFPPSIEESAKDLIEKLLEWDPSHRLGSVGGISEIRSHEFFKVAVSPPLRSVEEVCADSRKASSLERSKFEKRIHELCVFIGEGVLELESRREASITPKIKRLIGRLGDLPARTEDEKSTLERSFMLMNWFVEQTSKQIASELREADAWLKPSA